MNVTWTKEETKSEYYHGNTDSKFSVQIGRSTNPGEIVWMIFHEDSKTCQYGESAKTINEAMESASNWLSESTDWKILK